MKKRTYLIYLGIFLILVFGNKIINLMGRNINLEETDIIGNYESNLKNDYDELLKYHNIKINSDLDLTISKIKYRNIYEFKQEITIYKGFKDGIEVGDAVLSDAGLIGIIKHTYEDESVVELISNINSNISVKIDKSYGILKVIDDKVVVGEISNYDDVKSGDEIYTSGLGKIDAGLYIGKVKNINLNETEIEKIIEVDLAVDLNQINYVFIYGGSHD